MAEEPHTIRFKIVLLGDVSVGKSSLLKRYVDNEYDGSYISTIGVEFMVKTIRVDNTLVKLQIWDTAGQERFKAITQSYYRGCHGIFAVVDMTDKQTLLKLPQKWLNEIRSHCSSDASKAPIVIVLANKCDMTGELEIDERVLDGLLMTHFKTSAKTGVNVEDAFKEMTHQILERRAKYHLDQYTEAERNARSSTVSMYGKRGSTIKLNGGSVDTINKEEGGCSC